MTPLRSFFLWLLLAAILCAAGCTIPSGAGNSTANSSDSTSQESVAKYQRTLAQPEDTANMIRMDTDVYNIGEVVEFVITNERTSDLSCTNDPPKFSVRYQSGTGRWVTRMGEESPAPGTALTLKPGESTAQYRFVTDGWGSGRYRIVTDCGVSREILLRALPPAAPAPTTCMPRTDASRYIRVNPVSDQQTGEPFTISGTTSLDSGEELRYSIFAVLTGTTNITSAKLVSSTTTVTAGTCGINTWSVQGVIAVPGEYFIGISDSQNSVSAVKRFTVLQDRKPTATATLPEAPAAPGITTG